MDNARNHAASAGTVLATAAIGLVGLVGGAGCAIAASETRLDPTHRWISKTVESRAQYRYDNKECAAAAGDQSVAASEGSGQRRDAPAFAVYERCMGERGYQLATY